MRLLSLSTVLAAMLTVPSIAAPDTNVWTSLGPDGGYLLAIAIDPQDSNTLYAASNGGISKTTDGGMSWNPSNSGLPTVSVTNIVIDTQHPDTLYVSATVGIFKSTDAGASWNSASSGLPVYAPGNYIYVSALAISPQDPNTLYAGLLSDTPGVFKSTDGGANWTAMSAGLPGYINVPVADAKNQGTVYAITADQNGMFKTTNGGLSWTQMNITAGLSYGFAALAVDPQDSNTLYASEGPPTIGIIAKGAPLHKSADGGATWTVMNTGIPTSSGVSNNWITILAIDPQNSRNLYAGTLAGLYKSNDGALTWSKDDARPEQIAALALDPQQAGVLYAGTAAGLFKSADGAGSWSAAYSGLRSPVMAIYPDSLNPGILYAINQTSVSKSVDSGTSWNAANSGLPANSIAALALDSHTSGTVYAGVFGGGTQSGGVFKTVNGGATWQRSIVPRGGGVEGLAIDPQVPTTLYAWNSQGLYKTSDGSTSWKAISSVNYADASSLVVDPHDSNLVYVLDYNSLLKSTDAGATWSSANSGFPQGWFPRALAADPQNTGTLYAWSNLYDPAGPKLFKTTDGAASWNPANSGLQGNDISSLVIDPQNANSLYAATSGYTASGLPAAAIFASSDGGSHWSLLSPGLPGQPAINGLTLSPQDPNRLYAATSGGTFALTIPPPATGQ